jgi:hypothetical protein
VNHDGAMRLHRHRQAAPDPLLQAFAPYRAGLGVAVECMLTWSWLAALCAHEGRAFVLGSALYRQAMHGGKAQHDSSDSPKMAGWRRGGLLPPASG